MFFSFSIAFTEAGNFSFGDLLFIEKGESMVKTDLPDVYLYTPT